MPVNPGGIPIYRGGKVIGGVGVAGVRPAFAEYAATAAAAGAGRGMDFSEPLGAPGAVFIDGLRLPFFAACTNITCIRNTLRGRPPGSAPGLVSNGTFVIQPRDGIQAPEGGADIVWVVVEGEWHEAVILQSVTPQDENNRAGSFAISVLLAWLGGGDRVVSRHGSRSRRMDWAA